MKQTASLYTAIIVVLTVVFEYFTEHSGLKGIKVVFQGANYQKGLEQKLRDVEKAAKDAEFEAVLCQHKAAVYYIIS